MAGECTPARKREKVENLGLHIHEKTTPQEVSSTGKNQGEACVAFFASSPIDEKQGGGGGTINRRPAFEKKTNGSERSITSGDNPRHRKVPN